MYTQTVTPNPDIPCKPGWCLQYVRQTYGLPAVYPTATAAWEASATRHRGRDFPAGVWIPVWYGVHGEPAGHVVLRAPDGSCYSTSTLANTPYHHPNLAHLEAFYARHNMALTYRGWTEDVAGYTVITPGGINPQGNTTEEDTLSAKEVQEIKDYVFETVGTMLNQYHTATRNNIIEEVSKKIEDSEYDVKVFTHSVDNSNADRVILDNRAVEADGK